MQFLRYLIFLPGITFSFVASEIFPWALFYTFFKERKFYIGLLPFLLLILFSSIYTLIISDGNQLYNIIRVGLAYINPILIFIFLLRANDIEIKRLLNCARYIFFLFIALGFLQINGLIGFLDPVISTLIPRGSATALMDYDRGVTLLSSEPSRAGIELLLVYAIYRIAFLKNSFKKIMFDVFIILFQLLVLQSATGILVSFVYFAYIYKFTFILLGPLGIYLAIDSFNDSRIIYIISELAGSITLDNFLFLLMDFSGFRGTSIISSYYYGLSSFLGGGIGLWETSSIDALKAAGIDPGLYTYYIVNADGLYIPARPEAYVANVALDFGILGLIIFLTFLYQPVIMSFKKGKEVYPITILFLFIIFLSGSVGNPLPWIAYALSLRINRSI